MNCPTCKSVSLVMSERQGIEIDYCPECRGVWLDRGELDKIIEKSITAAPTRNIGSNQPSHTPQQAPQNYNNQYSHGSHQHHSHGGHYKKKREGFLSDLFDF